MPRVELYHFEYFDEIRRRWVTARYVATKDKIEQRYPRHRVTGAPEIRDLPDEPDLGIGYSAPRDDSPPA